MVRRCYYELPRNGHEMVVKLRLKTGKMDMDLKEDRFHQSPLIVGCVTGVQDHCVCRSKTGEVNVDSKDSIRRTPAIVGSGKWA